MMAEAARFAGSCHCGNLELVFETPRAPEDLVVRSCSCSFCRRHGARCVSDPAGAVRLAERLREIVESTEFTVGPTTRRYRVRAGYSAVPDFSQASIDAVEVVLRAATALRHLRTTPASSAIADYDAVPGRLVR